MSQRTIRDIQNDLAHSMGHGREIVWDSLSADQEDILKEKIKNILPYNSVCQNEVEKARINLFQNVWSQRKYTNLVLLSSIIYVMVTEERDLSLAMFQSKFTFHPLIRTRKCLSSSNSSGCCMIFVDEHSRIYQNWQDYLQNNKLPKGTMIAPKNGVYTLNEYDEVVLEVCATPNSSTMKKLNTAIGVGGLITGAAPLALSMFVPIAAPIMITASVVSVATSTFATLRSASQLKDRYQHGQSTSLVDREARGKWLEVAGGVAGIGATGATNALAIASSSGKGVTLAAKVAVGGINVSSLVLSGSDIVNTIYDLYLHSDDGLSSLDILQLASSLLVLTHSINNLALVSKIPTRGSASVRRAIRKQARRSYEKLSSECVRFGRNITTADLIRIVNTIPSKEAFIQQIGLLLVKAITGTSMGTAICEIPKLIKYSADGELNPIQLLGLTGFNYVGNILNMNSFIDLLHTMATFMCQKGFYLLLNLSKTFMDEFADVVNDKLRTFVPTEKVLHEMFMLCVTKYSNLSYEFLESKQLEIIDNLQNYFYSLNPIDVYGKRFSCKLCNGYYYDRTL